ncbi:MAG: hypothetical protein ACFCD0_11075 [Gemmataceae bacterium]
MSTSVSKNQLGNFLKEARAIIAREGQLTAKALAEVHTLGVQHGLSVAQLEKAVAMLKASKPVGGIGTVATKDEQVSFRDVVETEVRKTGALTPWLKRKLLACAAHQTQLSQEVALKIITKVTTQLGVAVVNEQDAYRRLHQQIEDTSPTGEPDIHALQTFCSAAHQIGRDRKSVDQILSNIREKKTVTNQKTLLYAGLILAPILLAAIGFGIWASWPNQPSQQIVEGPPSGQPPENQPTEGGEGANEGKNEPNHWWKKVANLEEPLIQLKKQFPKEAATFQGLSSADEYEREKAFQNILLKLSDFYRKPTARPHLVRFLAGCYAGEPSDNNARYIETALVSQFPRHTDKIVSHEVANFQRRLWFAEAAVAAMKHPDVPDKRRDSLQKGIEYLMAVPLDMKAGEQDLIKNVRKVMCQRFVKNVLMTASEEPNTSLQVFGDLESAATPYLSERTRQDAKADLLMLVLKQPKADSKLVVPMLSEVFPKLDLELKEFVLGAYRDAEPGLGTAIEPQLRKNVGAVIEPKMSQKEKAEAMLKVIKNYRYFLALANQRVRTPLTKAGKVNQVLQETIHLAHASTLGTVLTQRPMSPELFEKLKKTPVLGAKKKSEPKKKEPKTTTSNPVAVPAGPPPVLNGSLNATNPTDRYFGHRGCRCFVHVVPLIGGRRYVFDMSATFDSYLRLESPTGRYITADNDGGPGWHARIYFDCPVNGHYRLTATSYWASFGQYAITIRPRGFGPLPPPVMDAVVGTQPVVKQEPKKVNISQLLPLVKALHTTENVRVRIRFFQQLAKASDGELNTGIARALAKYILTYDGQDEFNAKVQSLKESQLKESRELKLACVDYLATDAELFRVRVESVFSVLLGETVTLNNDSDWRREARKVMLKHVIKTLKVPNYADEAAKKLREFYVQQAQALGMNPSVFSKKSNLSGVLDIMIRYLGGQLQTDNITTKDQETLADIRDHTRVANFLYESDLQKTVALQRQWFRSLAVHVRTLRPNRKGEVASIQQDFQDAEDKDAPTLGQLREAERHILRLWTALHKDG